MSRSFLQFLESNPDVWIKSFWGWSPETWGGVGFTNEARARNISLKASDPFLFVINVTKNAPHVRDLRGKLVGAYKVEHIILPKRKLISDEQMKKPHHPKKAWEYTFKAVKAWTLEKPLEMTEFYPELFSEGLAQSVATWGRVLPKKNIEALKRYNWKDAELYKGS